MHHVRSDPSRCPRRFPFRNRSSCTYSRSSIRKDTKLTRIDCSTYSPNLEFTFELSINTRSIANAHLAPANLLPVTPSLKGKSSFSRLKQLVSPSKKPRIVEAPTPTILQYTDLDKHSGTGVLASVRIDFARDAAASKNRVVHLSFPLHSASSHASSSTTPSFISSAINKPLPGGAKVNVKFFYLPAIEGVDGRDMPRSVKECIEGISLAEKEAKKQAVMMKEGTLTQVGGDCDVSSPLLSLLYRVLTRSYDRLGENETSLSKELDSSREAKLRKRPTSNSTSPSPFRSPISTTSKSTTTRIRIAPIDRSRFCSRTETKSSSSPRPIERRRNG